MKKLKSILIIFLLLFHYQLFSQTNANQFKWVDGANTTNQASSFGVSTNGPGARVGAISWELNGKMYLYGGNGFDATGSYKLLSDLWVYDPVSNNWTYLKGIIEGLQQPVFGTLGVESPNNLPGNNNVGNNLSWVYNNKLYLICDYSSLDDIWCYNPATNNWTWIKGSNIGSIHPNHGSLGIANSTNTPGHRSFSSGCLFNNKFYLFGGFSFSNNLTSSENYTDLWEFDLNTNNWRWLKGPNIGSQPANYGAIGIPTANNNPGTKRNTMVLPYNNKLYLFGGYLDSAIQKGYQSDMWVYDIASNNWTWIKGDASLNPYGSYGTLGVSAATNNPGGRSESQMVVINGKFYLYGGYGYFLSNSSTSLPTKFSDLWEYNTATNNWTWINGLGDNTTTEIAPTFGNLGISDIASYPGSRLSGAISVINNKFYLFGGNKNVNYYGNDLWNYDPMTNVFTWIKGSKNANKLGIYNAPLRPGAREKALNWTVNDKFYLMGGQGKDENGDEGYLNDLWEYNPTSSTWAWLKGSKFRNPIDNYGTINVGTSTNTPGGRVGATSWQYNNKLYLFGGTKGFSGLTYSNNFNDVWQFDLANNNWTWIKGGNITGNTGSYGTINNPTNNPPAKEGSSSVFHNGKLYLFGGSYVYGVYGGIGPGGIFIYNEVSYRFNELWTFDHINNNWNWIKGSNIPNQNGNYFDLFNPQNQTPGSREGGALWAIDNKIYLFGGYGYSSNALGYLNDFWEFNTSNNNWQWAKGSNLSNINGNYGSMGISAATNTPGGRTSPYSWTFNNKIYLMGGGGHGSSGGVDWLNDLWEYKPATNNWTWLKGSFSVSQGGVYGTQNVYNTNNIPGARSDACTWLYNQKLFQFGGIGYGSGIGLGLLNDLWEYTPACTESYSVASGDWNTGSTWYCNRAPLATESVNIYGHTIDLTGNGYAKEIIYNPIGTVRLGVGGNLILNP